MFIRRTVKIFRRTAKTWERGYMRNDKHIEEVIRWTYWVLFIPVYSKEEYNRTGL